GHTSVSRDWSSDVCSSDLMQALGNAQVVAFSQFACSSTRRVADVILPIGALPEIDATLTNLDGRDQQAVAGGKLPGEARAGWRVLRALGGLLDAPGFGFTDLAGARAGIAPRSVAVAKGTAANKGSSGLEIAMSQAIYRGDATVRRAAALQAHPLTLGARIALNPTDAAGLAGGPLTDGTMVKVSPGQGTAPVPLALDTRVAAGTAWIESGYGAT